LYPSSDVNGVPQSPRRNSVASADEISSRSRSPHRGSGVDNGGGPPNPGVADQGCPGGPLLLEDVASSPSREFKAPNPVVRGQLEREHLAVRKRLLCESMSGTHARRSRLSAPCMARTLHSLTNMQGFSTHESSDPDHHSHLTTSLTEFSERRAQRYRCLSMSMRSSASALTSPSHPRSAVLSDRCQHRHRLSCSNSHSASSSPSASVVASPPSALSTTTDSMYFHPRVMHRDLAPPPSIGIGIGPARRIIARASDMREVSRSSVS